MSYTTVTVSANSAYGTPLAEQGDQPILVYNPSDNTNVYLSSNPSFTIGQSDNVTLRPLMTIVLTNLTDNTYAATSGVSGVQLELMPAAAVGVSPVDVAIALSALGLATSANQNTQISTEGNIEIGVGTSNNYLGGTSAGALISTAGITVAKDMLHANSGVTTELAALIASGSVTGTPGGVPLLSNAAQLISYGGTITGSTNMTLATVTQISYDGFIEFGTASAGPGYLCVSLQWESAGGYVFVENYYLICGSTGSPATVYFRGPCKGESLLVTLSFNSGITSVVINNFYMYQNSRPFTQDRWYSDGQSTITYPGFTNTAVGMNMDNILHISDPNIAASGSITYPLPMYCGRCSISGATPSNTTNYQMIIEAVSDFNNANSGVPIFNEFSNASGIISIQDQYLPKAQCQISLRNNAAAAETVNAAIVTGDF